LSITGETRLIGDAFANAAATRMLADDVACLLFPHSGILPSEELQTSVRLVLKAIISAVETELGVVPDGPLPQSWEMLSRSGLLREPGLIDYCLARIAERRIRQRIEGDSLRKLEQLPARLLRNDNPLLAEAARNILVAETRSHPFDGRALLGQLPIEQLHPLAWRVVAVLQTNKSEASDVADSSLVGACQAMLGRRNDAAIQQTAAAKLVYFLPAEMQAKLADPISAGVPVFVAALSARTAVSADLIYRYFDGESAAAPLVLMRAAGFDSASALACLQLLCGTVLISHQLPQLLEDFDQCPADKAAQLCLSLAGVSPEPAVMPK
jgi:hypothetical protein